MAALDVRRGDRLGRSISMLLLVASATFLVFNGCRAAPHETSVTVPALPAQAGEPISAAAVAKAEHITTDMLYRVYSLNLNSGANRDQRFLNRPIVVTGVFNGINRGLPGRVYLELRTHDDAAFTYAALGPGGAPLLRTLVPGETVTLVCLGDGMAIGSPRLRDCRSE